ncbi:MAG: adenosylmethionine decarboxylase [Desulfurococcales archaeon]|nr:adenosylmethionine decarboxylase [Desulfurococcales archaeon]MEB3759031.1 adenosylmethionine decarboxylase [Desulfurococcales archaeon]MEB3772367.1 adenosylmethionine decarboxylase [Desulfurococcales archaeon]MEB3786965.1 adenosylmethionine decarboxylase [Desulfurococcales archaeon]MEB3799432.1 adenosylmethionine decarboxylase [Desulfurococcales archaeon]
MSRQELISNEVAGFRVVGKHVYGNLIDCMNENLLSDVEELKRIVIEAAEEGNMTLLDVKAWKIGLGVSVVAIILESHITIHTWPEYKYATVDVYSCGSHTDPHKAFEYIVSALKPRKVEMGKASRSLE